MKKIISVSGSHCVGKSTYVRKLKEEGKFAVNDTQLSRSVQKRLGACKLSSLLSDKHHMWHLQNLIMDALEERDASIPDNVETIVERCPLDLLSYAQYWSKHMSGPYDDSDDLKRYILRANKNMKSYVDIRLLKINHDIEFIAQDNRASEESRDEIEKIITKLHREWNDKRYT